MTLSISIRQALRKRLGRPIVVIGALVFLLVGIAETVGHAPSGSSGVVVASAADGSGGEGHGSAGGHADSACVACQILGAPGLSPSGDPPPPNTPRATSADVLDAATPLPAPRTATRSRAPPPVAI